MDHFKKVLPIYSARGKQYHGLNHITKMFNDYYKLFPNKIMSDNLYQAILYHDVVYNIPNKNEKLLISNEAASVEFYIESNKETYIPKVVDMIYATEHHFDNTVYDDYETNVLLDLDIFGFCDHFTNFYETQKTIDLEYKDKYDPIDIWNSRNQFLKNIYDNRLLKFRVLSEDYENKAYFNIASLLMHRNVKIDPKTT